MHYHAEVWLPDLPEDKTLEELITAEMAPHIESYPEDGEGPRVGFWDWYQIGGRWTGEHDRYKPETNPDNLDQATGKVKWPTQWASHPGDVIMVTDLPDDFTSYTLILGERVFHQQIYHYDREYPDCFETVWDGNTSKKLAECMVDSGVLVTVDYHS